MSRITPNLWFKGTAEDAVNFYLSIFPDGKILSTARYPHDGLLDFQKPFAGKVLTITFEILGQQFVAINAGDEFTFNESVSFSIACKDQQEIDYYWSKITADGGSESVCGWCKDKFGLSWQIGPENMEELMRSPGAWSAMLGMKKIVIEQLKNA